MTPLKEDAEDRMGVVFFVTLAYNNVSFLWLSVGLRDFNNHSCPRQATSGWQIVPQETWPPNRAN